MFSISTLFTAFLLVFIAELGDKTQLVAFSLTSTSRKPLSVFLATSLALVLSSLIAVIFGKITSGLIPAYTRYISAGLFIVFGVYIIVSRDNPKIKDCFLEAVAVENEIVRLLPKIFNRRSPAERSADNLFVVDITGQDRAHAGILKSLISKKLLFKDDINDYDELDRLIGNLREKTSIRKLPFREAVRVIIVKEKAVIDTFSFIHNHLDLEHHEEEEFQRVLEKLIEEDRRHIRLLSASLKDTGP